MIFRPQILKVLDACARANTFPMLDNGYFYLAATRLSVYRSDVDWALVIETFGFSPREGNPSLCVQTFGSRLRDRNRPGSYVNRKAYENYLANNPSNELRSFWPVEEGAWQDSDDSELLAPDAQVVTVRSEEVRVPGRPEYAAHGIALEEDERIRVFELCRYLADVARPKVLATAEEQRGCVPAELHKLLQLEDWNHPDLVNEEVPSGSECFIQLARVLETGDTGAYRPTRPANTHWSNWPAGGTL